VLRRGVSAERKINEGKTRAIYTSHRPRLPDARLTMHGRKISFVSHVKYVGVILDMSILWRMQIEMIEEKTFITINIRKPMIQLGGKYCTIF
jgi:hypothetical protein